jgi:hypothetical protein
MKKNIFYNCTSRVVSRIKTFHNTILPVVAYLTLLSSCNDFLREELTTQRNTDYYLTDEGILSLAVGVYNRVLVNPIGSELWYCHTNYGVDEFSVGSDGSNELYNSYSAGLASITTVVNGNTVQANAYWDMLYIGIGSANTLIKSALSSASSGDRIKKTALGEGYFLRALSYFRLVNQFGGVPLVLEPITTVEREFTRASAQEVLNQVIDDFAQAYTLLPASASATGRLTRYAAAHFLAKALLTRASEINDSWNASTKTADLQEVIRLAEEVIAHHPLADNFTDLWNYTKPDDVNELSDEVILAIQFTADVAALGANYQHLFYLSSYDDLPYMQRDLTGGRPWNRLRTTYYVYRTYDLEKDSRFWKSFRTKYRINNPSGDYYQSGDLGIMYIINRPGDDRFASVALPETVVYEKTGKTIPSVFVAWPAGVTEDGALYPTRRFPPLNKFLDGSRISVNEMRGLRDLILARSGETYLLAAEAEIRLARSGASSYERALPYINAVRRRAGYKTGEDRTAYVDGGGAYASSPLNQPPEINSYMPENAYYESMSIAVTTAATDLTIADIRTLPAQDEAIIAELGYTDDYDRMLCFLLNERTRELCGEFLRWEDLSRTQTLVHRAKTYNPEAAPNIKLHHSLRPIPQTYLDGIRINGRTLTPDEKQAQQNPGY